MGAGLESVPVIGDGEDLDLAVLVVPAAGSLAETGNRLEPYQLVDPAGVPVLAVSSYFRDLQAAGRATATVRSYGDGFAALVPVLVGGWGALGSCDARGGS